jgi:uracil phosphoribosyltransferase
MVLFLFIIIRIIFKLVFLLDPVICGGNMAISAIAVLLKNGVKEENILFVSLVCSALGIKNICL